MQLIWGSQNCEQGQHDLACIAIQIHPASSSNTLVPLALHDTQLRADFALPPQESSSTTEHAGLGALHEAYLS